MLKKLKAEFQKASDEMLISLKNDNLTNDEKKEWFGYMRGVRDCAYSAGILSETTIQENLIEALNIIK